ncbi:hypothetical protein [Jannaschia aquimarina]|uniref:Uncharacterized protein n=1 Tax=Jannaschia aquimarina TaxID=935700 RepID=A0A0D1EJQ2_9RHOB|nr:hypothetical protein [Jannaschia aquimarina]KIT17221.1 hypothetical protein jaqu_09520 [Jannaschia aquimarina]SNT18659.1 hypothetical protein SAMN05421775_10778 [Jannaschia aquimarina]
MRPPKISDSNLKLLLWAIGDILMTFLRSLASAAGMMAGGAVVGGITGGGAALAYGMPLGVGLLIGAIAGFLLAAVVLYVLSAGSNWF